MAVEIITTRSELREALGGSRPGLVPTMGALHAGHLSLVARSAQENAGTVVSVFVNPTQFSVRSDLDRYPRDLDRDAEAAASAGAEIVFAPEVAEIYPPGFDTTVAVSSLGERWEGASRPGHFRGVATVVTILLNLIRPTRSYFGEKDYQQLHVVRQIHRDLALPGEIVGCATVRDHDGLALASRNSLLSPRERSLSLAIPRAITRAQAAARAGETDSDALVQVASEELDQPGIVIDYIVVVDGDTLDSIPRLRPGARILLAAVIGDVRLIDNDVLDFREQATP